MFFRGLSDVLVGSCGDCDGLVSSVKQLVPTLSTLDALLAVLLELLTVSGMQPVGYSGLGWNRLQAVQKCICTSRCWQTPMWVLTYFCEVRVMNQVSQAAVPW